jgi:hypothetical protein
VTVEENEKSSEEDYFHESVSTDFSRSARGFQPLATYSKSETLLYGGTRISQAFPPSYPSGSFLLREGILCGIDGPFLRIPI